MEHVHRRRSSHMHSLVATRLVWQHLAYLELIRLVAPVHGDMHCSLMHVFCLSCPCPRTLYTPRSRQGNLSTK